MEIILWVALGITAWLAAGAIFFVASAAFAVRLHRRTSEKLQAERKGAGEGWDG